MEDHVGSRVSSGYTRRGFLKRAGATGVALGGGGVLGGLATGCGSSEDEGPAPRGTDISGDLSVVYRGEANINDLWRSIADLFEEKYPDVSVEVNGIASDSWAGYFDTLSVRIAGGEGPDVVRVATEGMRLFADRGLAMPLDEYIERDNDYVQSYYDDVNPRFLDLHQRYSSPDDQTYYLPGEYNTMCMWYSKEIFQQAGVAEPDGGWTWDEFLDAAREVTNPGEVFGMWVEANYFASFMPWLLTNGANTLNEDWTASTVATPEAVEAAEFMRSMVEDGISPKPGGEFDPFSAMAQGRLAMYGGGRWPLINMRDQDYVDSVGIVPWPQRETQGSPLGWSSHAVMQESENKEAAWAFAKFMTEKETVERFTETGGTEVPARESVATSEVFLENSPEGSRYLYEALDYATPVPSPNRGSVIEQDIIDTITQILAGNTGAETALRDLDERINSNL